MNTIDFGIYTNLEWEKLSSEYLHGLADMGNAQAKKQLDKIYNSPIQTQEIGFGKFSGSKWVDLDVDYLYWMIENVDTNNIKYILASRALDYIKENVSNDDIIDIIHVD